MMLNDKLGESINTLQYSCFTTKFGAQNGKKSFKFDNTNKNTLVLV